jgi:hypothetical protein
LEIGLRDGPHAKILLKVVDKSNFADLNNTSVDTMIDNIREVLIEALTLLRSRINNAGITANDDFNDPTKLAPSEDSTFLGERVHRWATDHRQHPALWRSLLLTVTSVAGRRCGRREAWGWAGEGAGTGA